MGVQKSNRIPIALDISLPANQLSSIEIELKPDCEELLELELE
jgi:hypothetical protein